MGHYLSDLTHPDPPSTEMLASHFKGYSDGMLQAELDRRKKEREEKEAADRKAREVRIVCPSCQGSGTQPLTDGPQVYGTQKCLHCNGNRTIIALRAE